MFLNVAALYIHKDCEGYLATLKHCVNRPNTSWSTLMGRECKRRTIRRQTPYRISVLQFVLICTAMYTSFSKTDVCIKLGKHHILTYPESTTRGDNYALIFILAVEQWSFNAV